MPTQQQIAEHLDLSQKQVSELMARLGIGWTTAEMGDIRVAYIRHLRSAASGHKSEDGYDLIKERVLSERVDRELKQYLLAEKKGGLVNVAQLEPELLNMVGAFRAELLARDDKLKSDLDALYGIDIDLAILNDHTYSALGHLSGYGGSRDGFDSANGGDTAAAGAPDDNGMGAAAPGAVG